MSVSPVGAPVGHGELDLAGPLPLQQQPGRGVERLVAHVGGLGQLPGLSLDKLLVTISDRLDCILLELIRFYTN